MILESMKVESSIFNDFESNKQLKQLLPDPKPPSPLDSKPFHQSDYDADRKFNFIVV